MMRFFAILAAALIIPAVVPATAGDAHAQAAYVHEMAGTVTGTLDSVTRQLKTGDVISAGTTVTTGDKSRAVIKFEDGQIMALAERSSFRIVEYRYVKERVRDSNAVFALLQGGLRFITGVMGSTNHNSVRINAGTSTLGIRGTDGTLAIDAATQAVTAAVNAGLIALSSPQGTQNVGPGNFSESRPGQAPTGQAPLSQASPLIQAVASSLASQPVPLNTPVVVALSARAAAAAARAAADPSNAALQRVAQEALQSAIQAAEQAFKAAVDAGAVPPSPPSPPPSTPLTVPGTQPGATGATETSSTTGATGAGGAGGGGGGSTTCTPDSASPC